MNHFKVTSRLFLIVVLLSFSKANFSQYRVDLFPTNDITGKPFELATDVNINGNPYFPENYTAATLYFKGGGKTDNIKAKIYLPEHSVLYNLNDTEMVATIIIEKIEFLSSLNGKERAVFQLFPAVGNSKVKEKFYQVIDTGKAKLLKLYTSDFTDKKEFGSATVTRTYEKLTDLYAYSTASGIVKINGSESLLSTVFTDKQKQMTDFISKNDINTKKEKDLKKLFAYYNSL